MYKTVSYEYLFLLPEERTFRGKSICGASIELAVTVYKNGRRVHMVKEPEGISVRSSGVNNPDYNLIYLSDILDVFFTKKDGLTITKNEKVESLFHARYGYGNVSHETIKCKFYFKPTGFNNLKDNPSTEFYEKTDFNTMEISKEDFYSFLTENRNDFDNTENCKAQSVSCSSVSIF